MLKYALLEFIVVVSVLHCYASDGNPSIDIPPGNSQMSEGVDGGKNAVDLTLDDGESDNGDSNSPLAEASAGKKSKYETFVVKKVQKSKKKCIKICKKKNNACKKRQIAPCIRTLKLLGLSGTCGYHCRCKCRWCSKNCHKKKTTTARPKTTTKAATTPVVVNPGNPTVPPVQTVPTVPTVPTSQTSHPGGGNPGVGAGGPCIFVHSTTNYPSTTDQATHTGSTDQTTAGQHTTEQATTEFTTAYPCTTEQPTTEHSTDSPITGSTP
ncbi:hypothetical protein M3Y97_01145700 [Aphelenchoides bicaudatus]|nr:hypothetical protein M3Y97_01145700 [Aphelenchoides bicaudatus]